MIKFHAQEMDELIIVGGGLAGCEAAWQAAKRGISVRLYEMRPLTKTLAHRTSLLAEIICSNSLGSKLVNRASGLLAAEIEMMDSLLLESAKLHQVPAGRALAIDRQSFSQYVQDKLSSLPNVSILREEVKQIPDTPVIIASGPLTSPPFAKAVSDFCGQDNLFFFDALAPIIESDSINMDIAFWGSRYEMESKDKGDYINCPFNTKEEYENFITELTSAERINLRKFENEVETGVQGGKGKFFEACLPIEVMASRGMRTLAFGPLRPVGLYNPHTGKRPYAVIQLRQDNQSASLFNIVGFQTNLTYPEQKRVFRLIPGLEKAEFNRYGQMHRNTYIYAPDVLKANLQSQKRPDLFMAGQLIGVEGYLANIATGLLAGINAARYLKDQELLSLPETTMIGSLCRYISTPNPAQFQPMKANFGILPPLEEKVKTKPERFQAFADRALINLSKYLLENHEIKN